MTSVETVGVLPEVGVIVVMLRTVGGSVSIAPTVGGSVSMTMRDEEIMESG